MHWLVMSLSLPGTRLTHFHLLKIDVTLSNPNRTDSRTLAGQSHITEPDGKSIIASVRPSLATLLPDEILIDIFKRISFEERVSCQAVCRRWRKVVTCEPALWG